MTCPRCGSSNPTGRLDLCPGCLLSGEEPEPVLIGGSLELLEPIGRGGMGTVYRARHRALGRTVAVKFLPPELAAQEEFRVRFEREARALALLNHPNIVAVHDFGEVEGRGYIVMEYVDGASLAPQLPLPVAKVVDIGLQVCDALAAAHRQGVVHRDIKPENILIDGSGRVKVTDFGIARITRPDTPRVTETDVVLGTPSYMAPEAMAGAPPHPRMDVYALGVVLYQAATGRLPQGAFEPAPAPLDPVIRKALASDPERRYASAEEMRRDLAAVTPSSDGELPPEERNFMQGVAILQSISTAVALWAALVSVTPKVLEKGDMMPLISIGNETLPDGKILSKARFETGWTLLALGVFGVAITCYGLLRRHWRRAGLERPQPGRPVATSATVFWTAAVGLGIYAVRRLLESRGQLWAPQYIPVVGGLILVAILFFFWLTILEAWRTSRPLRREPLLWIGSGLALLPPALELLRSLRSWQV